MYIDTETNDYPLSIEQVKECFPNTSFAEPFSPPARFAFVFPADIPDHDVLAQRAVETDPVLSEGDYEQQWQIVDLTEEEKAPLIAARRLSLLKLIDADADRIYADIMGNRVAEYTEAEAQAKTFKEAGYIGEPGEMVVALATASGNGIEWAADDILAQADAWRTAQAIIRTQRLSHKAQTRSTEAGRGFDDIEASWSLFVENMRGTLGAALVP